MAEPMRLAARMKGNACEIRILVRHPMRSGLAKDQTGNPIPAHYIQTLTVAVNGRPAVTAQMSPSIPIDPVFGFETRAAKPGDTITVTWKDSKGESRSDETKVV